MEEKFKDIIGLIVLVGGIIMGLKRNFMYANNPGTTKLFIFILAVIKVIYRNKLAEPKHRLEIYQIYEMPVQ